MVADWPDIPTWTPCAKDSKGWQDATLPNDGCVNYLRSVGFDPLPKQYDFITCPAEDVGFGGARGGAKTGGIIGDWLWHEHEYGEDAIGFVFRRERTQLMEFIEEAKRFFCREPLNFKWHGIDKVFAAPSGARLRAAYLDKDSDADAYQGGGATRVYIEERGTFPRVAPLNKMHGILRSGRGVPAQMKSTFNPGGPGHHHCKADYRITDQYPKGYDIFTTPEGISRVFIPSRLRDNKYLGEAYVRKLRAACAGNEALLNAWLDGDWSLMEDAFLFLTARHIVAPFHIPEWWTRFRSIKWGSAKPFSVGWYAVSDGVYDETLPKGTLVKYREWYGANARDQGKGLKIPVEEIAEGIIERERSERIDYGVADPMMFEFDGGPSLIERMDLAGCRGWRIGDNAKNAVGNFSGWDQVRARLKGTAQAPGIVFFSTCTETIRTIPALQESDVRPEDIDPEAEAAAPHEVRLACMSRPYVQFDKRPKPILWQPPTMNQMWEHAEKTRPRQERI